MPKIRSLCLSFHYIIACEMNHTENSKLYYGNTQRDTDEHC